LSIGLTMIINTYFIIKTSISMVKRLWASIFMLMGMLLFFWGISETMVKFIDYLFKMVNIAITMGKVRF
jgi:hypothetical protein